jgi:hypothetical protein
VMKRWSKIVTNRNSFIHPSVEPNRSQHLFQCRISVPLFLLQLPLLLHLSSSTFNLTHYHNLSNSTM